MVSGKHDTKQVNEIEEPGVCINPKFKNLLGTLAPLSRFLNLYGHLIISIF